MKSFELIGKVFGRLTVIEKAPSSQWQSWWVCRCECGTVKPVKQRYLITGDTTSCGCLLREWKAGLKQRVTTHGKTGSREWMAWRNMNSRCYDPKNKRFAYYGGRGITVCPEWREDFSAFFSSMGPCPPSFQIERMDNSKGYSPSNCKWASKQENCNNRRSNVVVEYEGRRQTASQWASELNCKLANILYRFHQGWSAREVLFGRASGRTRQPVAVCSLPCVSAQDQARPASSCHL